MKRVVALPSFERSLKSLTVIEKQKLANSLELFNDFLMTGEHPQSFRYKKIGEDKFEFRVDLRLRVVVKSEGEYLFLMLAGSHDEVRKLLKNY